MKIVSIANLISVRVKMELKTAYFKDYLLHTFQIF